MARSRAYICSFILCFLCFPRVSSPSQYLYISWASLVIVVVCFASVFYHNPYYISLNLYVFNVKLVSLCEISLLCASMLYASLLCASAYGTNEGKVVDENIDYIFALCFARVFYLNLYYLSHSPNEISTCSHIPTLFCFQ